LKLLLAAPSAVAAVPAGQIATAASRDPIPICVDANPVSMAEVGLPCGRFVVAQALHTLRPNSTPRRRVPIRCGFDNLEPSAIPRPILSNIECVYETALRAAGRIGPREARGP
jgi:hypothetical protein